MSDFGAGTYDFHSDFASDFRTEGNDFASDFRDFSGDFGGAPRTAKHPPETPRARTTGAGLPPTKPQGNKDGGKPRSRGQRHAIRPQARHTEQAGLRL